MIHKIIELLGKDDFYGVSDRVDFAKGMYQYPQTLKQGWNNFIRLVKSK